MTSKFNSKKPLLSNFVMFSIILISLLLYIYVLAEEPDMAWFFLLLLIDVPLIGYIVISMNSVKYRLESNQLETSWFMGSYHIDYQSIMGYFNYKIPMFEFHIEANFIGSIIKRNNVGNFRLLSPGIRNGFMLEIGSGVEVTEKLFITPKNPALFFKRLNELLHSNYGKKFEEFNNRFYLKS